MLDRCCLVVYTYYLMQCCVYSSPGCLGAFGLLYLYDILIHVNVLSGARSVRTTVRPLTTRGVVSVASDTPTQPLLIGSALGTRTNMEEPTKQRETA